MYKIITISHDLSFLDKLYGKFANCKLNGKKFPTFIYRLGVFLENTAYQIELKYLRVLTKSPVYSWYIVCWSFSPKEGMSRGYTQNNITRCLHNITRCLTCCLLGLHAFDVLWQECK